MARIRSIKPEFWADEKLGPLDPLTRLVFLGLISMADDSGRVLASVKVIDSFIFPHTNDTSREALATLSRMARVVVGNTKSGQAVLQIANWKSHQRVDHPNLQAALPPIVTEVDGAAYFTGPLANESRVIPEALANDSRGARDSIYDLRSTTNDLRSTTNEQLSPRGKRADRTTKAEGEAKLRGGYPARLAEVWAETMGHLPPARFGICKPVVEEYGLELTAKALGGYCRTAMLNGKAEFASPALFTKTARQWVLEVTPFSKMTREEAASIGVLDDWLNVGGGTDLATEPSAA